MVTIRPADVLGAMPLDAAGPVIEPWQPRIVLPDRPRPLEVHVSAGDPTHRPDAVRRRLDAARALLACLGRAHETLGQLGAAVAAGPGPPHSPRARVCAAIEGYRAEATLEEILGTLQGASARREERRRP